MAKFRMALLMSAACAAVAASGVAAQVVTETSPSGTQGQTTTTGDAATRAGSTESGVSEDIVVTAQKREQVLLDVPQSVTVVGGAALERQQATNFQDYLKLVPGLQLNQSTAGVGRLVLRGVNTGGVASTVAVYLDETPLGSSSGQTNGALLAGDIDTFDVSRIEVLRGPQGSLYGASSLGGVLKFVTNDPETDKLQARGRASVETVKGGDLSYFGSALINVPLGDTLAIRASGFYRKFGGFIDSIGTAGSDVENDINDSKSYGGRAAILFKPSDSFSIKLSALLQNLESGASSEVESDFLSARTLYGRPTQSQFVPESTDVKYRVYNGTATLDLGFADLTSTTSYSTLDQRFRGDLTTQFSAVVEAVFGTPNEFFLAQKTRVERFTQEVRLSSGPSTSFEWQIGGYYNKEDGVIDQTFNAVNPGTLTAVAGLPLLGTALLPADYEEIAGFANATVYFGSRFDVTLGGRYSRNEQDASQVSDGVLAGGATNLRQRSDEDVFTYSVAPKFKINDRASLYARVATGFRPGGPNILPPAAPAELSTFESDTLTSYEIGLKAETEDRSFTFDAALFQIDWDDIQLFALVNGFGVNTNGGGARVRGFEFTTTVRPTRGFNVSVNGAYTNAKLRDDTDPLFVGGRDGDRLPFTPKFSLGINGDYEWDLSGSTTAYVGGSVRFLSEQPGGFSAFYLDAFGRQPYLPSYEVVDLRAGVNLGAVSVELYARNLTNSDGKTSLTGFDFAGGTNVPNGAVSTGIIRPRSFGVTLGAGF